LPFEIAAAYDIDDRAVQTYRLNLADHAHCVDLTKIDLASLPSADVLTGGFPCQDFSSCGPKRGLADRRGNLYTIVRDYMQLHRPKVVIAENVPHLRRMKGGRVLDLIVEDLSAVGYTFKVWDIYCPDYGLPQSRRRLFFVGVREDIERFPIAPQPTHVMSHIPIEFAIRDLERVRTEEIPNQSQYFVATRATAGAGQGDQRSVRTEIAYTVRANPKARVHFHYSLRRRLTVRECARLQSFPDEFVFPHAASQNFLEIGNAIPPIIAHVVGKSIAEFLLPRESGLAIPKLTGPRVNAFVV
jgi:DNA (cytosine-5)-methyltransferase 1